MVNCRVMGGLLQRTHKETPYGTRRGFDRSRTLCTNDYPGGRCDLRRLLCSSRDRGIALVQRHFSSRPLNTTRAFCSWPAWRLSIATRSRYRDPRGKVSDQILPLLPRPDMRSSLRARRGGRQYGVARDHHPVELARNFRRLSGNLNGGNRGARERVLRRPQTGRCAIFLVRERPVGFLLSVCTTASEVTSVEEFIPWHDIFLNFPPIRFSRETPEFAYIAGALRSRAESHR